MIQLRGIILILMAILGKVGAAFCMIPEPIMGALAVVSLGAVFGELEHNYYQTKCVPVFCTVSVP